MRETRWHREYAMEEPKSFYHESKFADGSAVITLDELERESPTWSDWERVDFCQEVGFNTSPELPNILRFVMKNGERDHWSAIAMNVVAVIPPDEAIPFLFEAYSRCEIGEASNILQALAKSGAPEAHKIHRDYLRQLWAKPDLFKEERHFNHLAAEAVHCIRHQLGLGEPLSDFKEELEALAVHPNEANRTMVKNLIERYGAR